MNAPQDLGRCRGVWVPAEDIEAHLSMGWVIADTWSSGDHVLMRQPANDKERAA